MHRISLDKYNYTPFILFIVTAFSILITCFYRDLFGMECRNAIFAKEMLNHIKFIPTYMNVPYPDYTPIYFWLEVFFAKLIGNLNTISAVLPSCIAFIGIAILLYYLIKPISEDLALLTCIIFLSFPKVWDAAAHVTIDILLSFTISVTLICLYIASKNKKKGQYNLKWFIIAIIFMILSFWIKGLIGIVLSFAVWNLYLLLRYKKNSILRILYFSIICLFIAIICQSFELFIDYKNYGYLFMKQVISLQVTSRLAEKANHSFFYYIPVVFNCIFPWFLVLIYLILYNSKGIKITDKLRYIYNNIKFNLSERDLILFGISWFLAIFLVFELASCKHSRYLYPAMPGLAICLAILIYKLNYSKKLSKFFKSSALAIIFLPFIPIILKIPGITLHIKLLLLCIIIGFICWYLISYINVKIRPWFYLGMMIIYLMSSFSLLFNTVYSQKQSGSQFMHCINTNSKYIFSSSTNIPIYVYGINRDGNGVKLSYYAAPYIRLKFITNKKLLELKAPFILICYKKDSQNLLNILEKKYKTHILCKGLVHKVPTEGFFITQRLGQGKCDEQIFTSNTIRSTSKCLCPNCSKTGDEDNW